MMRRSSSGSPARTLLMLMKPVWSLSDLIHDVRIHWVTSPPSGQVHGQEASGPWFDDGRSIAGAPLPGLRPEGSIYGRRRGAHPYQGSAPRACFRRIAPATCANDLPLE